MASLRRRAIIGGAAWAILSFAAGGVALLFVFEEIIASRFDDGLSARQFQVVSALARSDGADEGMFAALSDPAFDRPFSGTYWQVESADGRFVASRSLFDARLPVPSAGDRPEYWNDSGTGLGPLRGMAQSVELEDGSVWTVSVAENLDRLYSERDRVRGSLILTLALIGMLGILGAILQASATLRPLARLREEVVHRWDRGETLNPGDYPDEVAPLVEDINVLLKRARENLDRSRRQAADVAHALKTPVAILRNELQSLADRTPDDLAIANEALARVEAQLRRSLARLRASNSAAGTAARTDLSSAIDRLGRVFARLAESHGRVIEIGVGEVPSVAMDEQDLNEILGNILDNALKWSRKQIVLRAARTKQGVVVSIEDDGPGIADENRRLALEGGIRFDESVPGTGLGLSIASDLLAAYGGALALDRSPALGGLRASVTLPLRPA